MPADAGRDDVPAVARRRRSVLPRGARARHRRAAVPRPQVFAACVILLRLCVHCVCCVCLRAFSASEQRDANAPYILTRTQHTHALLLPRRLKMGVCAGEPRTILPDHLGRADYHGASVNQAARYMDAAAHGGQVVCEEALALEVCACLCVGVLFFCSLRALKNTHTFFRALSI